jgi:hypothetical protein
MPHSEGDMKVLRNVVVAGAAIALMAGPASAAPAGDAIGSANGGGWRLSLDDVPRVEFSIDSWITPAGGITGSYRYANPFASLTFSGPVTCLNNEGSSAAIGGVITSGSDFVGQPFLVFMYDNGEPTFGEFGPDQVSQTYLDVDFPEDFPTTCPDANENPFEPDPFSHLDIIGDVTVNDGS